MVNTIQHSKTARYGNTRSAETGQGTVGRKYACIFRHVNAGFSVFPSACGLHGTLPIAETTLPSAVLHAGSRTPLRVFAGA